MDSFGTIPWALRLLVDMIRETWLLGVVSPRMQISKSIHSTDCLWTVLLFLSNLSNFHFFKFFFNVQAQQHAGSTSGITQKKKCILILEIETGLSHCQCIVNPCNRLCWLWDSAAHKHGEIFLPTSGLPSHPDVYALLSGCICSSFCPERRIPDLITGLSGWWAHN